MIEFGRDAVSVLRHTRSAAWLLNEMLFPFLCCMQIAISPIFLREFSHLPRNAGTAGNHCGRYFSPSGRLRSTSWTSRRRPRSVSRSGCETRWDSLRAHILWGCWRYDPSIRNSRTARADLVAPLQFPGLFSQTTGDAEPFLAYLANSDNVIRLLRVRISIRSSPRRFPLMDLLITCGDLSALYRSSNATASPPRNSRSWQCCEQDPPHRCSFSISGNKARHVNLGPSISPNR